MKTVDKEALWLEYQKKPTQQLREQLIIEYALTTVQIVVPILLIIFVSIDFATVVISPGKKDEDAMKKAISRAVKRGIAAIAVFFIPLIVKLILSWAGITDTCGLTWIIC